jgi:hypothetical protein
MSYWLCLCSQDDANNTSLKRFVPAMVMVRASSNQLVIFTVSYVLQRPPPGLFIFSADVVLG